MTDDLGKPRQFQGDGYRSEQFAGSCTATAQGLEVRMAECLNARAALAPFLLVELFEVGHSLAKEAHPAFPAPNSNREKGVDCESGSTDYKLCRFFRIGSENQRQRYGIEDKIHLYPAPLHLHIPVA